MAATVITSGASADVAFGLLDETGLILTSFSRSVQSNKAEVMDADGDVVAVAYYGKTAQISLSGIVNGATGWSIATSITLANDTSSFGVGGGQIVVNSISEETGQDTFKTISVDCTQYPEM